MKKHNCRWVYKIVYTGTDYAAARNEIATLGYYTARNEINACLPASNK